MKAYWDISKIAYIILQRLRIKPRKREWKWWSTFKINPFGAILKRRKPACLFCLYRLNYSNKNNNPVVRLFIYKWRNFYQLCLKIWFFQQLFIVDTSFIQNQVSKKFLYYVVIINLFRSLVLRSEKKTTCVDIKPKLLSKDQSEASDLESFRICIKAILRLVHTYNQNEYIPY